MEKSAKEYLSHPSTHGKGRRKAEISTTMLVGIIILIISFVIILFVLLSFDWGATIDRDACHESVVYRSLKAKFIEASEVLPLHCKTEKICLSMSGEDCKELVSTDDNKVRKIKLSNNKEQAKEEVKDEIADAMANCHWMLGEGKLDFMPHHSTRWENRTRYGLICSRIVFDDKSKEEIEKIPYREMYSYLAKKKNKDGQSYLEYLYPGWKNPSDSIKLFEQFRAENEQEREDLMNFAFNNWAIYPNRERGYGVVAIMAPYTQTGELIAGVGTAVGIAAGVTALAFFTGGTGLVAAVLLGSGGTLGAASIFAGGAVFWYNYDDRYYYAPPTLYPFNISELKEMQVYNFDIAPD